MLFGLTGFIIGPIIAALFVTIWDIYGTVFADALPAVGPLERAGTPVGGKSPEDDEAQEGEKAQEA